MLLGFSQPWNAGFRRNSKARSKNKKTLGNKKTNVTLLRNTMIKQSKHSFVYKTLYLGFLCLNNALSYDL